jgi:hypothetical protein
MDLNYGFNKDGFSISDGSLMGYKKYTKEIPNNFPDFLENNFSDYYKKEFGEWIFGHYLRNMAWLIENQDYLVLALPRNHAKTTLCIAYIVYLLKTKINLKMPLEIDYFSDQKEFQDYKIKQALDFFNVIYSYGEGTNGSNLTIYRKKPYEKENIYAKVNFNKKIEKPLNILESSTLYVIVDDYQLKFNSELIFGFLGTHFTYIGTPFQGEREEFKDDIYYKNYTLSFPAVFKELVSLDSGEFEFKYEKILWPEKYSQGKFKELNRTMGSKCFDKDYRFFFY